MAFCQIRMFSEELKTVKGLMMTCPASLPVSIGHTYFLPSVKRNLLFSIHIALCLQLIVFINKEID